MKKKKATPKSSPKQNESHDMPSHIQRARILTALEKAGTTGKSTLELREDFNIMHPGGRVLELREAGYPIDTVWTVTYNLQGHRHRCARYVLRPESNEVAA